MNKWLAYGLAVLTVLLLAGLSSLSRQQVLALSVFFSIIGGTLFFWDFRLAFALVGLGLLLAGGLLNIASVIEFAGLDIVLFLIAMMILIGFLEENQFFEFVVEKIVGAVKGNAYFLVGALMATASLFASLVDEVTSILFMTTTVLHIAKRAKIKPQGLVMMIVFATNIGSAATVIGNPIGVMIALRAHYSFFDFLRWASPAAFLCLAVTIPLCFLLFRKDLKELGHYLSSHPRMLEAVAGEHLGLARPKKFVLGLVLLLSTVSLLVFHSQLEKILNLEKNTLLLAIAFFAAGAALFVHKRQARDLVMKRVDWWTLCFFLILFATVGTLKHSGISSLVASNMLDIFQKSEFLAAGVFNALAAVLTAFMDNVLVVATFIPVIEDLVAAGIDAHKLWWGLLFSGTLFGNATIIGSTANIVALGVLDREGHETIGFWQWFKPGILISTVTLLIALGTLYWRF